MNRYLLLLAIVFAGLQAMSQKIETDIFDNLEYESRNGSYEANLKKDIFDNIIFTDSNDNEITLKKEYLDLEYGAIWKSDRRIDLFRDMIREHRHDRKYEAIYSVDIFKNIVIEDNRNRKVEIGEDIFGNTTYKEEVDGVKGDIRKGFNGKWEYDCRNEDAELEKDFHSNWVYSDSRGNEFKISKKTWEGLMKRFGSEEEVFIYLIHEFLHI